jgi:hypothetical protein
MSVGIEITKDEGYEQRRKLQIAQRTLCVVTIIIQMLFAFFIFLELGFINILAYFVPIEFTTEVVSDLEEAWCQSNIATSLATLIVTAALNSKEMYDRLIVITHQDTVLVTRILLYS